MTVFINDRNEIKDVGSTLDTSLTPIEVDDMFKGWSVAKICCYKLYLNLGKVCGFTPYVDSRIIEHIDQLGTQTEEVQATVSGIYDPGKTYTQGEYCTYNNNLYRFNMDSGKGIFPGNNMYWTLCNIAEELNRIITIVKEN